MTTLWERREGRLLVTTIVTGAWRQNAYIVADPVSREAAIIDPGGDADALREHVDGLRVVAVLLTHAHYDHLGAASALMRETGARCWVHQADAALLWQAPAYAVAFERSAVHLPDAIAEFSDGHEFPIGGMFLRTDRFPGHTPGSVAYQLGNLLFSGDTLLRRALGRTDLPGGDPSSLRTSIRRMMSELPTELTLLPGHGRPWTMAEAHEWWREHNER